MQNAALQKNKRVIFQNEKKTKYDIVATEKHEMLPSVGSNNPKNRVKIYLLICLTYTTNSNTTSKTVLGSVVIELYN